MSVTITLDKQLAERLRKQAASRNLSLEQWTLTILADVSQTTPQLENAFVDVPENWRLINAKRVALIRKSFESALTVTEKDELRGCHQLQLRGELPEVY